MKPLISACKPVGANSAVTKPASRVQITYESQSIRIKIAKSRLNNIKIKPDRKTKIINKFQEIIDLI